VDAHCGERSRRERLPGGPGIRPQEGALDRPRGPLPTRITDLPPLPAAYADAVDAGLASQRIDLTAGARAAIDGHVRLLLAWNDAINLTAIRDPAEVARAHVLDSLAAVPPLRGMGVRRFLDLGSGGGFPGLPLSAALGAERVLLVDSVGKKVQFLRAVIHAVGLEATTAAEQARSEALAFDPRDREAWPAVTVRAVASVAVLVELALPLLQPGGVLVAWKGASAEDEVVAAAPALRALRAGPVRILDAGVPGLADHRLVVVPRDGPIDDRFPRDPAERRHRPL
jgi:16S rRNA (guanine527-N7)-methyltransferase